MAILLRLSLSAKKVMCHFTRYCTGALVAGAHEVILQTRMFSLQRSKLGLQEVWHQAMWGTYQTVKVFKHMFQYIP